MSPPYTPNDLRSAYDIARAARTKGRGVTVAIVDAFRDPNAGRATWPTYRQHFGLPACTRKNGCLKILNQNGRASHLPRPTPSWAGEESLDLDMVSAICPHCRIVLVETNNSMTRAMGTAERTAARRARFVSNSWSGGNFAGESRFNGDFNHRGHVIDFAAGDFGYGSSDHHFPFGVAYPTGLPFVTAVGGTTMVNSPSRGRKWTETVWGTKNEVGNQGTNSGCTKFGQAVLAEGGHPQAASLPQPGRERRLGEREPGDGRGGLRLLRDASEGGPWLQFGGTSEATPIITAMWALAGRPGAHAYPVSYLYKHVRDFYDVRSGSNGKCAVRWLCHAERGFDGPTGLGTPHGIGGLRR